MDLKEMEALIAAGGVPWEMCHDCGAKLGRYHHANCDVEQCPICGGQLIGCNCEIEYTNNSPAEAQ